MPTHLCDLFESDEEEVEGYTQDEVDQLEALLNSEMCEESGGGGGGGGGEGWPLKSDVWKIRTCP